VFYYYGGKGVLASAYPAPKFPVIIEPFAGAASYSVYHLIRRNADRAILVEKDPRTAELWTRLLAMTPYEVRALVRHMPAVGEKTSDWLWMTSATSNVAARCQELTVSPRMASVLPGMVRRIAAVLTYVKGRIEVHCGDYREAPEVEATWFIDPPYQPHPAKANASSTPNPQGMGYARGCSADDLDFQALGQWAQSRPGQVIVCEQDGADWLPFRPLVSGFDSGGRLKTEVMWAAGR
jgi:16S rRNA G966 N2-methylase RsmD